MRPPLPAALVLALAGTTPASAATSYDSCTGFIDALPIVVSTPGTWCLRKDLTTALGSGAAVTVATNNVTVDCNGFRLGGLAAGAGTQAAGVLSQDRLNTSVRGCRVRGFFYGIALMGDGGGHLVEDSVIEGSTFIGIAAYGDGTTIRRNRIIDTGGSTVQPLQAAGLYVNGSLAIVDNDIGPVVPLAATQGANSGTVYGMLLDAGDAIRVAGNRVHGVQASGTGVSLGIYAYNSRRTQVADNFLAGPGDSGIQCTGTAAATVWRNHLEGFDYATPFCNAVDNLVVP